MDETLLAGICIGALSLIIAGCLYVVFNWPEPTLDKLPDRPSRLSAQGFTLGPAVSPDGCYSMPGLRVSVRHNGKTYSTIIRMTEEEAL